MTREPQVSEIVQSISTLALASPALRSLGVVWT